MSHLFQPIPIILIALFLVTRCDQQQALRNHAQTAHVVHPMETRA